MKTTKWYEKLAASLINVAIVMALSGIFKPLIADEMERKGVLIVLFFSYNILRSYLPSFRCAGMRLVGSYWRVQPSITQRMVYSVLYTLSFATWFIQIRFPFDLGLFNLLCLQLPCIALTGTTLHAWLSGNMITVKTARRERKVEKRRWHVVEWAG